MTSPQLHYETDDAYYSWPSLDAWARDWWQGWRVGKPDSADTSPTPAGALMFNALFYRPGDVIPLVVALAEQATSEQDLSDIGAGDIESLLVDGDKGSKFIDAAEDAAAHSPAFARALRWMWVSRETPEPLRSRLLALGATLR